MHFHYTKSNKKKRNIVFLTLKQFLYFSNIFRESGGIRRKAKYIYPNFIGEKVVHLPEFIQSSWMEIHGWKSGFISSKFDSLKRCGHSQLLAKTNKMSYVVNYICMNCFHYARNYCGYLMYVILFHSHEKPKKYILLVLLYKLSSCSSERARGLSLTNTFPASEQLRPGSQQLGYPLQGHHDGYSGSMHTFGTEIIALSNIIIRKFLLILRSINR